MKIVVASDHAGFNLKALVKEHLLEKGHELEDYGTYNEDSVDYPDFASKAARDVARGIFERGIIICASGIGVSIVANKIPGIRAALCQGLYTARTAREHNDANILNLGARVVGEGLALEIVDTFLKTPFTGGRHESRLKKITTIEKNDASSMSTQGC